MSLHCMEALLRDSSHSAWLRRSRLMTPSVVSDVVDFQIREIGENFLVAHAFRKHFQNIRHPDAHPANAGGSSALLGVEGNALFQHWTTTTSSWVLTSIPAVIIAEYLFQFC